MQTSLTITVFRLRNRIRQSRRRNAIVLLIVAALLSSPATARAQSSTEGWSAVDTDVLFDGSVSAGSVAEPLSRADGTSSTAGNPDAFELATYSFAPTETAIPYLVNPSQNDTSLPAALEAVQRAAQTWTDDPDATIGFTYAGVSGASSADDRSVSDGHNDIFWAPAAPGESFLARATLFVDEANVIHEFNIQLNDDYFWVSGADRGHDIESAVLHELGHTLGFEHVDDPSVAMQPTLSIGAPFRSLGPGDQTALLHRYGLLCDGRLATLVGGSGDDAAIGTGGVDVIVTGAGNDTIRGLAGDDIVCAGSGDDTVFGNAGNDRLFGHFGDDSLWGGSGDDTLVGDDGDDDIHAGRGADLALGQSGRDLIDGGDGGDDLRGGPDDDVVYGGTGDDRITGHRGDDQLFGERGFDQLDGGPGADRIDGGRAGDTLFGRGGDDQLDGGGGDDGCDAVDDLVAAVNCERAT